MICYKVVSLELKSVCTGNLYQVQYELDRWVQSHIGKLFVFTTLEDARYFANNSCRIFKAEADVLDCPRFVCSFPNAESIRKFWWYGRQNTCIPPAGTRWCNRVKLVEEV